MDLSSLFYLLYVKAVFRLYNYLSLFYQITSQMKRNQKRKTGKKSKHREALRFI